jgi:hypothetical protein
LRPLSSAPHQETHNLLLNEGTWRKGVVLGTSLLANNSLVSLTQRLKTHPSLLIHSFKEMWNVAKVLHLRPQNVAQQQFLLATTAHLQSNHATIKYWNAAVFQF